MIQVATWKANLKIEQATAQKRRPCANIQQCQLDVLQSHSNRKPPRINSRGAYIPDKERRKIAVV